jgi:hypothetical protein
LRPAVFTQRTTEEPATRAPHRPAGPTPERALRPAVFTQRATEEPASWGGWELAPCERRRSERGAGVGLPDGCVVAGLGVFGEVAGDCLAGGDFAELWDVDGAACFGSEAAGVEAAA